jgi:hypothetical protein
LCTETCGLKTCMSCVREFCSEHINKDKTCRSCSSTAKPKALSG